ncbi:MAG: hypothetical protein RKO25_13700 [Candidatus Contendobacter sp.]|nr:hypothetical protein [Candidatus Contendobacter sp.]
MLILALASSAVGADEVLVGPGSSVQASPQPSLVTEAEETQLKERVLARWQALIRGDFEAAYQFETPAYRAVYTPSQFRYRFGNQIRWRMANITDIHYDDDPIVARVRVEVAYRYANPEKGREMLDMIQGVNEVWLRKEGQWWRQQD